LRRLSLADPIARPAVWSRRLAVFALLVAAVAIGLARLRLAEPTAALTVFSAALAIAALAALLAISAASLIWREGLRGAGQAAFGFLLAAALLAYPAYLAALAFRRPPIHQVSTDFAEPPPFLISAKAREARGGALPPAPDPATETAQRVAYPGLAPVEVEMDSSRAYQLALDAAKGLGWRIVDSEPPNLSGDGVALIEATSRSLFFGFVSDIAIRIRPGATRTRIDARAVSRLGGHDFGANARRLRKFATSLKEDAEER
jgi:uncharacterized protein (DUF1499 family)